MTGRPLPQAKRLYNYSRYTAEEMPTDHALGRRWVRAAGFDVVEVQRLKAGTIERVLVRKPVTS